MLLSLEFHSLYEWYFKLRKENLYLKIGILSNILVHLSFYNWAWPFPLNGKTSPSLWASEQHFGVDLVVRPPCNVQILRRMTVVMSATSFMFRYVCMVRKTEWMLCGSFRAHIWARPFQLYPNVFAKLSNPKFIFLMKFIKDSLCNSEIWPHFKKKIVFAVCKTNWYLLSRNPVKKVFQLVSSVTISMSVESHGLLHNSCIEKCFLFWYRKSRSLAHFHNWKITFDFLGTKAE